MFLSRDDILKADDIKTETVACPEWGGEVKVRPLTGRERDKFEADIMVRRGGEMVVDPINASARIVALTVVDDEGKLLFSRDDVTALGEKSAAPINRIYAVAARLSGLRREDMEELTADFGGAGGGGSSSNSPNGSARPAKNSSPRSPVTS